MLFKFVEVQLQASSKGDWVYMCNEDLKTLNIKETYEEIKDMTHYRFKKLLNEKLKVQHVSISLRSRVVRDLKLNTLSSKCQTICHQQVENCLQMENAKSLK